MGDSPPLKLYGPVTILDINRFIKKRNRLFKYHFILEWDEKNQIFFNLGKDHPKYRPWKWMTYILFGFTLPVSCFVILIDPDFRFINKIISIFIFIFCFSFLEFGRATSEQCDDITMAFQQMKQILQEIDSKATKRSMTATQDRWKRLNNYMRKTLTTDMMYTCVLLPFFGVLENLDSYYYVEVYLLKTNYCEVNGCEAFRLGLLLLRFFLVLISFWEGCPSFATYVMIPFLWLEMQSKYLDILKTRIPPLQFYKYYVKFQIVAKIWEHCLNQWARIVLTSLFLMIVVPCTISIKYFGEMSGVVYWYMPFLSLVCLAIVYPMLELLVESYEETKKLLEINFKRFRSKILVFRQIKSLKPQGIKYGNAYILQTDSKASFYNSLVLRTVDGILI